VLSSNAEGDTILSLRRHNLCIFGVYGREVEIGSAERDFGDEVNQELIKD
jgi:hypothetical protein